MAITRYQAEATRVFDAPRPLVWALVSDTNRSDRVMGLAAATYRWDETPDGARRRVANARELGVEIEWIEPPYAWIEGRYVEGFREFIKGPVTQAGYRVRLEDTDDGKTRLTAYTYVDITGIARILGPIQRGKFRRGLARYLVMVEGLLARWRELVPGGDASPAAIRGRRLLAVSTDALANGPRTEADPVLLAHRAARLRAAGVSQEVADRIVAHLAERPDDEVSQMRPFELAGLWGLDRREVLRGFLHATVAGLTDLRWQINCPVCRVGASVVTDLSEVQEKSHCASCQIEYDTDFARHVEAVFPCNEAVRMVVPRLYCASSPAFLPHVFAQLRSVPGEPCVEPLDLPAGPLHVRVLGRRGGVDLEVPEGAGLAVRVGESTLDVDTDTEPGTLTIDNASGELAVVLIERSGWSADVVLGSVVASFPEFLDLFATEAPASGVELRVGHLALLFSDLVGSTALYERVGDARAFALVEQHFRVAAEAIAAANGAIVKTMGDAVMASFPSLRDAVMAAKAMVAAHEEVGREHGLGVKLGVHAGPCLAVRANDRLDYFGTTVNMAARLQARAGESELVLPGESADDPSVRELIAGLPAREFRAALKGIRTEQTLVALTCAAEADEEAAED